MSQTESQTYRNRSLLSLVHHSAEDIHMLLDLSAELKKAKAEGTEQQRLRGKNIALIFEKTSTRTRCAFEVAAFDQGGHVTYIDPTSSQIGHKESMKDTARVLGRYYDGIEFRGKLQQHVEELAEFSGVPVFNGLTDDFHPTQMLADLLTMREHSTKPLSEVSFAYVGDGRNNMGNSLLLVGAKLGMDVRIGAPRELWPTDEHIALCRELAAESGATVTLTEDPREAVAGVDFVHTDVWVSMGEPVESWAERVDRLLPFQVNADLLAATGNSDVKFMHCLPAFHNSETKVGAEVAAAYPVLANGVEVTEDVFESPVNVAFDQAENRMHTIKAVMVAALG
ncbi:MAG: ornithine carbamoyltransferase [Nocardioidaceae bacterium]